ncbi:DUF6777 domain-containing protein [Streptomyces maoxianensis]|uniref:DUF6777 domain-containing protein n=1 Tax=Streptomyces maoxianensis TaxID=1459942 RepID=A0ABV9GEP1_9ACTN
MRPPIRRRYAAVAGLSAALSCTLLVAGCGGNSRTAATDPNEVFLQPAAARGPDPYTASTARTDVGPAPADPSTVPSRPAGGQTLRTVSGSTPGLYGGTQSLGSCDAERQVSLLVADQARKRAFAKSAGVSRSKVPDYLRALTPLVLRADTRVTSHGFRDGSATSYQALLQAGTAVLVDGFGTPRVRCASGSPLKPPVAVNGTLVHNGQSWAGYQSDRVVVIKPTTQVINNFVIVNIVTNTWIERQAGTDGELDKRPDVLPPVAPDDVFTYPPVTPPPADSGMPSEGSLTPTTPQAPVSPPVNPPVNPPVDPPVEPPVDTPSEAPPPPPTPDMPPEDGGTPSQPDLLTPSVEPVSPDTFQG